MPNKDHDFSDIGNIELNNITILRDSWRFSIDWPESINLSSITFTPEEWEKLLYGGDSEPLSTDMKVLFLRSYHQKGIRVHIDYVTVHNFRNLRSLIKSAGLVIYQDDAGLTKILKSRY